MSPYDEPGHRMPDEVSHAARIHVLEGLRSDIRRVWQARHQFEQLDPVMEADAREAVVAHVLDELTVHAALEQELLYPALRDAMDGVGRRTVDVAEVGLAGLHALLNPLRTLRPDDDRHAVRFLALCQHAMRHMAWEDTHLFQKLDGLALDWVRLEGEIDQRREELVVSESPVAPA
ncbi:hemerythrin domain-containing protein [Hydrogenophaga laconesensis]|uniref:Hemerythrin HHE cation binding domain-containing protein n=1 Tax=Hydrogenophaga laconesensis TaxID=1805971 RepID=A0ABU1V8R7_9BURK|nr:hemerythrin domain-containing protein [Hydrogenophaga laconesensis]MDR7093861.1 hypothetical protein [Hydrogenophaga laconesensis]